MSENKVNGLMGATLEKIKSIMDVDTVMGTQINTPDGTIIIPICKVNYGFAAGGSDLPSKNQPNPGLFAGGAGGAVTISPTAFLIVKDGNAKIIQVEPFTSSVDRLVQMAPDVVDKITSLFNKEKEVTKEIE